MKIVWKYIEVCMKNVGDKSVGIMDKRGGPARLDM